MDDYKLQSTPSILFINPANLFTRVTWLWSLYRLENKPNKAARKDRLDA